MKDADDRDIQGEIPPESGSENPPKIVSTESLFGAEREIHIEHEGEVYRLRITRRGKLILQK